MRHFVIITNLQKDPGLVQTRRISNWLGKHGCTCLVLEENGDSLRRDYRYTDPGSIPRGTECVLVLGGDGTLLQAARDLVDLSLPLLGINMGKLGYLAEIELGGVFEALERLVHNSCSVEKRMMLEGDVYRGDELIKSDISLNDIVICRRGRLRIISFQIYVDGAFLCSYQADGIIIATPTGSTGYSLSAGGPIVSPDASLILLTAIAPHTISSRPVILPERVEITVELTDTQSASDEALAEVNFDGDTVLPLQAGDRVKIRRAAREAKLVRVYHTSFVEILRNKMN